MALYSVRYQAGEYSGVRHVHAEDGEHAIAKVKSQVRRSMSLPMYSERYQLVDAAEEPIEVDDA